MLYAHGFVQSVRNDVGLGYVRHRTGDTGHMALPTGCVQVCRPRRQTARKYTAKDVGRIACYAREAGEANDAILAAIAECVQTGECDCERIKQFLSVAADAVILTAALLANRRAAAKEAEALLKRVMTQEGKVKLGTLEKINAWMALGDEADAKMDESLKNLLDSMKTTEQDSFAAPDSGVTIVAPP